MGTPHNKAVNGDIARNVIMPGDPVRAEYIAKKYLKDCIRFNDVRCAYGYTGLFNGQRISVMASGMGMPSMGIYSYELYNIYDVDAIIRIGTAGALADNLELKDVVMAMGASTDSAYAAQYHLPGTFAPVADFGLLRKAVERAENMKLNIRVGNILTSDIFYNENKESNDLWKKMGVLAIDMETAALYDNAARAGKKALSVLTISDHLYRDVHLSADERSHSVDTMIQLALEAVTL